MLSPVIGALGQQRGLLRPLRHQGPFPQARPRPPKGVREGHTGMRSCSCSLWGRELARFRDRGRQLTAVTAAFEPVALRLRHREAPPGSPGGWRRDPPGTEVTSWAFEGVRGMT